jgi:hypothetical protein
MVIIDVGKNIGVVQCKIVFSGKDGGESVEPELLGHSLRYTWLLQPSHQATRKQ